MGRHTRARASWVAMCCAVIAALALPPWPARAGVGNDLERIVNKGGRMLLQIGNTVATPINPLYHVYLGYFGYVGSGVALYALPPYFVQRFNRHYGVDLGRIGVGYSARTAGGDNAMTDCYAIYFPEQRVLQQLASDNLSFDNLRWVLHELYHSEQCRLAGGRHNYATRWFYNAGVTVGARPTDLNADSIHDRMPLEREAITFASNLANRYAYTTTTYRSRPSAGSTHQGSVGSSSSSGSTSANTELLLGALKLGALVAETAVERRQSRNQLTVGFRHSYPAPVKVRLCSESGRRWPARDDRVYAVAPGGTQEITIDCEYGESICYGAEVGTLVWGKGLACQATWRDSCELTCGQREATTYRLSH